MSSTSALTWCLIVAFKIGNVIGVSESTVTQCDSKDGKAVLVGRLPQTCDASIAGKLYYSPASKRLTLCDGSLWMHIGAGIASEPGSYDNPIASCSVLRGAQAKSGTYWMKPPTVTHGTPFQTYCDFLLRPNGCALVWKHSYLQVTPNNNMRTFSTFNKPCTDLSDGWCNVANKDAIEGSEQVTAAYHYGNVVYAYRGDRNPQLGKGTQWQGAILNNPVKIRDYCTSNKGVVPEPENGAHAIAGITFDKANPGDYLTNCDTDRYGSSKNDCRWHNCGIPSHISKDSRNVQMTVTIYVC